MGYSVGKWRILLLTVALSASGCGHILRGITGEGTPHCKPSCAKTHKCAWTWVECSGVFGGGCRNSGVAECREK